MSDALAFNVVVPFKRLNMVYHRYFLGLWTNISFLENAITVFSTLQLALTVTVLTENRLSLFP